MSQTSFLESVVTWDERQCQQNVQDALPKLISHLQTSEVIQEEIGILKIICVSFLPWVQLAEAEKLVYNSVSTLSCGILDKLLQNIVSLTKQSQIQHEVQDLLELLIELLDCYSVCVKHVQQRADHSVDISLIHSLPYGAVHLLKETYTHCKESGNIYGDILPSITEPLSQLFKKAHTLQVALLGVLEKITVDSTASQQDVDDMCYICQGLFEVCQVVTSLDIKLVCSLWKSISRFSSRHKDYVKNDLDLDTMVTYLCTEITNGYTYLFQLAPPPVDSQEMTLSQGDSTAFQKSLKVLSYEMHIMVSLVDSFVDYISGCERDIIKLILCIYRHLPPSLEAPPISDTYIDDIRRHIQTGTEPLITLLMANNIFLETVTRVDDDTPCQESLSRLLLLVKVMDYIPKHTEKVAERWLSPTLYQEDVARHNILTCVFRTVAKCYVEMVLPITMPGVVCTGPSGTLYQYVCTHMCGLVGSLPGKYFHLLEECLLTNILSVNMIVSTLATDIWCFMARFGSAELCYQQTTVILSLCLQVGTWTDGPLTQLRQLVKRLVKFLAPEHQAQLLKQFPLDKHPRLFSLIPVSVYTSTTRLNILDSVVNKAIQHMTVFVEKQDKTYGDMEALYGWLQSLADVLCSCDQVTEGLSDQHHQLLVSGVSQLWSVLDQQWSSMEPNLCTKCLVLMVDVSGQFVSGLGNTEILKILEVLLFHTKGGNQELKLVASQFLQKCKKAKFAPCSQQPQILHQISKLFRLLLNDTDAVIHHSSLEAFTKFAENTPYESIVPECLDNSEQLQEMVVAYLNKKPYITMDTSTTVESYLRVQMSAITQYRSPPIDLPVTEPGGGSRDMLDEISHPTEPTTKRKRLQDDCGDPCDTDITISTIETCVTKLETLLTSDNTSTALVDQKEALSTLNSRLKRIIDKL